MRPQSPRFSFHLRATSLSIDIYIIGIYPRTTECKRIYGGKIIKSEERRRRLTSSESYRRYNPRAGDGNFEDRISLIRRCKRVRLVHGWQSKKDRITLEDRGFEESCSSFQTLSYGLDTKGGPCQLGAGIDCGYERVIYLSRFSFKTVSVYPSSSLRLFFFSFPLFLSPLFLPFCIVQTVQNFSPRQIPFQRFTSSEVKRK